ncbi:TonB-dependent receptor [Pseudoteredinibacter isoporae]|uniref:TonB-dependent receptor n=1 Tax=Pseudoteredinibacter isoporae TaxID=570281 RepID=UPI003103CEAE
MKRIFSLFLPLSQLALAQADTIETVVVEGRQSNLLGKAISASEGVIGAKEIALRPLLRTGEVLELVPGMVVTQHSGTGKANQYFLRGFNLDHGTDFANVVDGMPVNMRSHGHGQGYTDLNFIIPETIASVAYKKGAYYADVGDFSGAGSAHIKTLSTLDGGRIGLAAGKDGYQRLLLLNGFELAGGETVMALEGSRYDGPWSGIQEDLEKTNVLLKHTQPLGTGRLSVAFMAYDNQWNSADQIPSRAVAQGVISELGVIDDSLGGESSRYSVNVDWQQDAWHASAYLIQYDLSLWSNFTYYLDDDNDGDQFEQLDDRRVYGGQLNYLQQTRWAGHAVSNRFGADVRVDDIDEVGLYQTQARQRLGVKRSDQVEEMSVGLYWENRIAWSEQLRTVLGVRYNYLDFEVNDRAGVNQSGVDLRVNSGQGDDDIVSLKGSIIYSVSDEWEVYASAGQGLHSNDVRGATIRIDPDSGDSVNTVDPLVRSFGYEAGVRAFFHERLNASIALWSLELDSELLFVGDAGNTEASRASERQGIELTAYYHFNEHWSADLEYAYTDAEFSDSAPEGNDIPGAIEQVLQAGISADFANGWFGSLRLRHFGERPLIEDGSVTSDDSTIWNLRAGYRSGHWSVYTDVLNLSDSDAHDVDYYYESRLRGEAGGVEDIHYHVIEPRTVRVSLEYRY